MSVEPGLVNIGQVTKLPSAGWFPGAACLASFSVALTLQQMPRDHVKRAKAAPLQVSLLFLRFLRIFAANPSFRLSPCEA